DDELVPAGRQLLGAGDPALEADRVESGVSGEAERSSPQGAPGLAPVALVRRDALALYPAAARGLEEVEAHRRRPVELVREGGSDRRAPGAPLRSPRLGGDAEFRVRLAGAENVCQLRQRCIHCVRLAA